MPYSSSIMENNVCGVWPSENICIKCYNKTRTGRVWEYPLLSQSFPTPTTDNWQQQSLSGLRTCRYITSLSFTFILSFTNLSSLDENLVWSDLVRTIQSCLVQFSLVSSRQDMSCYIWSCLVWSLPVCSPRLPPSNFENVLCIS